MLKTDSSSLYSKINFKCKNQNKCRTWELIAIQWEENPTEVKEKSDNFYNSKRPCERWSAFHVYRN